MHDKDVQNKNQIKLLKLHYVLNDAISVCVTLSLYVDRIGTGLYSIHLGRVSMFYT